MVQSPYSVAAKPFQIDTTRTRKQETSPAQETQTIATSKHISVIDSISLKDPYLGCTIKALACVGVWTFHLRYQKSRDRRPLLDAATATVMVMVARHVLSSIVRVPS